MILRQMRWLTMAALLTAVGPRSISAQTDPSGFRVGDQLLLLVEQEPKLSDTFTVVAGPAIDLPGIGPIALAGVSRSDIEPYLTTALGKYLRHPVVHAKALLRIGVIGEVVRPGYYALPADGALTDAVMAAGGFTKDARVDALHIDRDGSTVVKGGTVQDALAGGTTLDHLGLLAGDALIVPRRHDPESTFRIVAILVTIPAAVFGITQLAK